MLDLGVGWYLGQRERKGEEVRVLLQISAAANLVQSWFEHLSEVERAILEDG